MNITEQKIAIDALCRSRKSLFELEKKLGDEWTLDIQRSSLSRVVDHPEGYAPMRLELRIVAGSGSLYDLFIDGIRHRTVNALEDVMYLTDRMASVFQSRC